jgi:hypothetical protein
VAKRTGRRLATARAANNGTSDSGKVNKAERIRQAAKALGKNVRPKDVIAELAKEHITVSSAQVSTTLRAAGYRRKRRGKKATVGASSGSSAKKSNGRRIDLESLIAAKTLIQKLGNIEKAEEALSILKKLQ